MNILLLGSGGREHALAWKIAASPLVERLPVLLDVVMVKGAPSAALPLNEKVSFPPGEFFTTVSEPVAAFVNVQATLGTALVNATVAVRAARLVVTLPPVQTRLLSMLVALAASVIV